MRSCWEISLRLSDRVMTSMVDFWNLVCEFPILNAGPKQGHRPRLFIELDSSNEDGLCALNFPWKCEFAVVFLTTP